ncbi:uncharacterized protein LACBIDRAFT_299872 [Laccaria bicolor S238N-H82]|uniref:Predicted protein n=1 Tax=Laccaria bicolor (strain S238N-H82 / ATCC MYA-4686) TaxID=486041 RepID=B0E3S4_LACBS|nr:uncharacterized protein LACBIDRAFT_299872 [Laccaria bicolor S238N-H82]EDQ98504.1 predicted protein [Laccaria bicolor S238N-H82]|eukprot:XP_001890842.1 predicted protein [Laccaria bicolor S238N-H82]
MHCFFCISLLYEHLFCALPYNAFFVCPPRPSSLLGLPVPRTSFTFPLFASPSSLFSVFPFD